MNTDKRDKGDKGGKGGSGEKDAQSEPTAPSPASAPPNQSSEQGDPTAAIKAIETIRTLALNAPTAGNTAEAIAAIEQLAASAPGARSAAIEAIKVLGTSSTSATYSGKKPKRAICLAGGGPVVGLHIGALEGLKRNGIDFGNARSIWALSCIGAWVGVVYNQAKKGSEIEATYNFFHDVFRDDKSFQSFPTNTIFAPDWAGCAEAAWHFLLEPKHYKNAILPRHIMDSWLHTLSFLGDRGNWGKFSEGDFNRWTLNHVLAVHPAVRFLTALVYKSDMDGRARLHYNDSKFLKDINFGELNNDGKPYIFHNAFSFAKNDIDIFANEAPGWARKPYKTITAESLCACSALPFVEQTVRVDGNPYCEGALVDTVNFRSLLEDHNRPGDPLEEIWINRIVDVRQIRKPENMHDALANLCQMFAATVGEDDIKLFKHHVRENNRSEDEKLKKLKWTGTIVEIQPDDQVDFRWSRENLDRARVSGAREAENAYKLYEEYKGKEKKGGVLMIPDDLEDDEITRLGVPLPPARLRERKAK